MPRFLIQRRLGDVSDEQLEAAALQAEKVRRERFADVDWDHTHVVRTDGGVVTFCVYEGPSVERIREHAGAAGIPADSVWEVVADLDPAAL
jgi:hypothetical protein